MNCIFLSNVAFAPLRETNPRAAIPMHEAHGQRSTEPCHSRSWEWLTHAGSDLVANERLRAAEQDGEQHLVASDARRNRMVVFIHHFYNHQILVEMQAVVILALGRQHTSLGRGAKPTVWVAPSAGLARNTPGCPLLPEVTITR
jgi:hypothetical protein